MSMWKELKLRMDFDVPLCGSVPRQGEVVESWVKLRAATDAKHRKDLAEGVGPEQRKPQSLEGVTEEHMATLQPFDEQEEMDKVWVGFSKDDKGLFIRGANIRAHLKDAAQVLGPLFKRESGCNGLKQVKNFKAKVVNALYIREDRVRMEDVAGNPYQEPTGFRDATMTVMTPQGPRTCLKRIDYVHPCIIEATIQLLEGGEITKKHIETLLEYGAVHGFGQDRSLQFGRYTWTLTDPEEQEKKKKTA